MKRERGGGGGVTFNLFLLSYVSICTWIGSEESFDEVVYEVVFADSLHLTPTLDSTQTP